MNELPAGLADPLHLAKPLLPTPALLAALATLALLWFLWRRRRRRKPPAPAPSNPPAAFPLGPDIGETIDGIRRRYSHADRRRGCHQLSAELRGHFERRGRHRFTTLTVGEIAAAVGDEALIRFFDVLAELQFGRREPSHSDFRGICDLAREVAGAKGR